MFIVRGGLATALALFSIAACSSTTSSSPPLSPIEAGASDAGSVVVYGGSGCISSCPAAAPTNGDACSRSGLHCEYGDFFDPECNTHAICRNTWAVSPPSGACPIPDVTRCPAAPAHGSACAVEGDICFYDGDEMCSCGHPAVEAGAALAPLAWGCAQTTCGFPRPRFGCACTTYLQQCSYGSCTGLSQYGAEVSCQKDDGSGAWWVENTSGGSCVDSATN